MARFAFLLLTFCTMACSALPAFQSVAPFAQAAQVAGAPGAGGATPTAGSGRPEPVTLWQGAGIFRLVAGPLGSGRAPVLGGGERRGPQGRTTPAGECRAPGGRGRRAPTPDR